eukprot:Opistho-2@35294
MLSLAGAQARRLVASVRASTPTFAREYHAKRGCYGFRTPVVAPLEEVSPEVILNRARNANVMRLVTAYRSHGHKKSEIDPLGLQERNAPELNLRLYGLEGSLADVVPLNGIVDMTGLKVKDRATAEAKLEDIVQHLENTYCGKIGVEFEHISNPAERAWFADNFERRRWKELTADEKKRMATLMAHSEVFDNFMQKRFGQVKRYGAEGAEAMMVAMDEIFRSSSELGVHDVVLCMPHRGRLNLLTDLFKFSPAAFFHKVKGNFEFPEGLGATGDVISHLTNSVDIDYGQPKPLHVTMIPNPSHLEACNPVAIGKTRAKQMFMRDGDYKNDSNCRLGDKALCVQVHGDAAFCAQGVVMETLSLSCLPHYTTGGSVHLIVNNQLGFTTPADRARSTRYSSDVGKMIEAPVLHVNGDCPEEVLRACRVAIEYRMRFKRDIIVDLICYRRHGHNELDDPSFTQPVMYDKIRKAKSVPKQFEEQLVADGILGAADIEAVRTAYWNHLDEQLKAAETFQPEADHLRGKWAGVKQATDSIVPVQTGVDIATLEFVGKHSVSFPPEMKIHKRLKKSHIDARLDQMAKRTEIDWATAEALAFGSLMLENYNVRISGQDVGRGTFSHRHVMLIDQDDDSAHVPLNTLAPTQGHIEIANSNLSEFGVLGFEYGVSIENPNTLPIWEAQFGDFFNGAQIIIDTYISNGETKWLRQSGLVMLLPHGFDGAGPEHSSCRVERFLQMTDSKVHSVDGDNVNMSVINPTTPANYFHALRRQLKRTFRKPLIVVGPKTLLRLPAAVSPLDDMATGTTFQPVLSDKVAPEGVRRVAFVSGKVYYELIKAREALPEAQRGETAFVRVEELCPFPAERLKEEIAKFTNAEKFLWVQEEPLNMGAWQFVEPRFEGLVGKKLQYVGRAPAAAAAVGVSKKHKEEVATLFNAAFNA